MPGGAGSVFAVEVGEDVLDDYRSDAGLGVRAHLCDVGADRANAPAAFSNAVTARVDTVGEAYGRLGHRKASVKNPRKSWVLRG